jgi:hypothetical protein
MRATRCGRWRTRGARERAGASGARSDVSRGGQVAPRTTTRSLAASAPRENGCRVSRTSVRRSGARSSLGSQRASTSRFQVGHAPDHAGDGRLHRRPEHDCDPVLRQRPAEVTPWLERRKDPHRHCRRRAIWRAPRLTSRSSASASSRKLGGIWLYGAISPSTTLARAARLVGARESFVDSTADCPERVCLGWSRSISHSCSFDTGTSASPYVWVPGLCTLGF